MKSIPCEICSDDTLNEVSRLCDHCQSTQQKLIPFLKAKKARDIVRSILMEYENHDYAIDYFEKEGDFTQDEDGRLRLPPIPPWLVFSEEESNEATCRYCESSIELPLGISLDEFVAVVAVRAGRHSGCWGKAIEEKKNCQHGVFVGNFCDQCNNDYANAISNLRGDKDDA